MRRFDFVSLAHEATILFHTDHSVGGAGFSGGWRAIDVSACPSQTLTAKEGSFSSPNYPNFLLEKLDCAITILAPPGYKLIIFNCTKKILTSIRINPEAFSTYMAFIN